MEILAQCPWVFTYRSRSAFTSAGRQLQMLGLEPVVDVVVESFLALGHFIVATNRLGCVQAALAPEVARLDGLRILEPPFDATPTANALWWHPVHDRDPEHAWMRSVFLEAAREVSRPSPTRARFVGRSSSRRPRQPFRPPAKPWMNFFWANM